MGRKLSKNLSFLSAGYQVQNLKILPILVSNDTNIFLSNTTFKFINKEIRIVDIEINNTENYILIQSEKEKIWRRSFFGTYFIYDNKKKEMRRLTEENKLLRNVKFSPDGNKIVFIFE